MKGGWREEAWKRWGNVWKRQGGENCERNEKGCESDEVRYEDTKIGERDEERCAKEKKKQEEEGGERTLLGKEKKIWKNINKWGSYFWGILTINKIIARWHLKISLFDV